MAPEQEDPSLLGGAPIDGRADLFAFGKLLFHMLTGASPRTIRPPSKLRPELGPAWDDYIFKLVEERPERRFSSAWEALHHLPGGPGGALDELLHLPPGEGRGVGACAAPAAVPARERPALTDRERRKRWREASSLVWFVLLLTGALTLVVSAAERGKDSWFGMLVGAAFILASIGSFATCIAADWRPAGPPERTRLAWALGLSASAVLGGLVVVFGCALDSHMQTVHDGVAVAVLVGLPVAVPGAWGLRRTLKAMFSTHPGEAEPASFRPVAPARPESDARVRGLAAFLGILMVAGSVFAMAVAIPSAADSAAPGGSWAPEAWLHLAAIAAGVVGVRIAYWAFAGRRKPR